MDGHRSRLALSPAASCGDQLGIVVRDRGGLGRLGTGAVKAEFGLDRSILFQSPRLPTHPCPRVKREGRRTIRPGVVAVFRERSLTQRVTQLACQGLGLPHPE